MTTRLDLIGNRSRSYAATDASTPSVEARNPNIGLDHAYSADCARRQDGVCLGFCRIGIELIELARRNRHVAEVDGWPASGRGRRPRRLAGAVEPPRRRRGKSKRPSGQGGCRPPDPNASKSYAAAARFAFARPSIIRPIPRELLELRVEATIHQRDPTALRRGANGPINFRLQCKRVSAWPDIRARKL